MSSDSKSTQPNVSSTPQPQGENLDGVRALEEALAGINSVLGRDGEELSEHDLAKVLKQLEAAEGVADDGWRLRRETDRKRLQDKSNPETPVSFILVARCSINSLVSNPDDLGATGTSYII
ncbi:hypothetical protein OPQ81_002970 [Rhizoctonia solani]|nr:hypothetical protein OPQ81_002970 [Rhizoctonia solani]